MVALFGTFKSSVPRHQLTSKLTLRLTLHLAEVDHRQCEQRWQQQHHQALFSPDTSQRAGWASVVVYPAGLDLGCPPDSVREEE